MPIPTIGWMDRLANMAVVSPGAESFPSLRDIFRLKADKQQIQAPSPVPGIKKDSLASPGTGRDTINKAKTSQMFDPLKTK